MLFVAQKKAAHYRRIFQRCHYGTCRVFPMNSNFPTQTEATFTESLTTGETNSPKDGSPVIRLVNRFLLGRNRIGELAGF